MQPSDWIALSAVGVSGLALTFGWLTARTSANAQSRLAEDERLWKYRVDLYLRLLDLSNAAIANNNTFPDGIPEGLNAQVAAFASERVREAWTQMAAALDANYRSTRPDHERHFLEFISQQTERWTAEVATRLNKLHSAVRSDLRSDRR